MYVRMYVRMQRVIKLSKELATSCVVFMPEFRLVDPKGAGKVFERLKKHTLAILDASELNSDKALLASGLASTIYILVLYIHLADTYISRRPRVYF